MKTKFLIFIVTIFSVTYAVGQDDCEIYYPMKEGAKFQITHYGKSKKKASSVVDYTISKVEKTSKGTVSTMTVAVNEGGKNEIPEQEIQMTCSGNKLSIDFESLMNPELLAQYGDIDYEITGTNLEWPSNLSVGTTLPDAKMDMNISMGGMNMTVSTVITNREVIGKEKVTTPAGTFDCYVMTYNTTVNTMGMNTEMSSKQWFSKGVGMVKQEDTRKGKLQNTSELTAFSM